MAVVQISRIQIRRGRKNSGSGLPQLASGEFGWAVDSQELFIGNGSVAEGSPYVGNTKLLSEHDDIFEYAQNYTYRSDSNIISTGIGQNSPVQRTLQQRLDDRVSVRSFGAKGDGSDQTQELQRALDQLYLNPANKNNPNSRVALFVEAGRYTISSTLFIPPFVTLIGAGSEKTIFESTTSQPILQTVNGSSVIGSPADDSSTNIDNQCQSINIQGITLFSTTGNIVLKANNLRNSVFDDIIFRGVRQSGDSDYSTNDAGIVFDSLSTVVTCKNNLFYNCKFENLGYAVTSDDDVRENVFNNCKFENLGYGMVFGSNTVLGTLGQQTGPLHNKIKDCVFENIDRHAILIDTGIYNSITESNFFSVGNDAGLESNATYPCIKFEQVGNIIDNNYFSRSADLSYNQDFINGSPYVPTVEGPAIIESSITDRVNIGNITSATKVFRLPAKDKSSFVIEYQYTSRQIPVVREGTLKVTIDPINNDVVVSDDFNFLGDQTFADNLILQGELVDEDQDGNIDTVAITVLNSTSNDDADLFFKVISKQ